MSKNTGFSLDLFGDLDFEWMVVDVSCGLDTLTSVNYEKGINDIEIELVPYGIGGQKVLFPLEDFCSALQKAKELAIKCAKEDEQQDEERLDYDS